ncbi:metallophosphoesterase family protein [Stutzerimonas azotifigens]|uniref:Phosphoesterase n=1 Tax=Stutzerimonas azotifigens TaxID=291995 RepID=A0ABR5YZG3_9GAMM|nr:metallophosphoesterase family protein [Stutzerimonas azotifigens]MBA1273281.1 metallophosphoesterase family protein [Stutzerimonas azotifigens]
MDFPTNRALRIGLIADTHGLLRPEALERLRGCDHIVHAGDIGKPEILQALERIAPLSVVRGNNDQEDWAEAIPERLVIHFGRVSLYLLHDLKELDIDPAAQGIRVVISGHSHKPAVNERDGVIYLNPGSAGPRRFKLPISLALLHIQGRDVKPELLTLE